ncbi:(deoxy)nucleoside triphosphate pyrophosphohydrolase [Microbacterium sp. ARD31]|uniref:(deoxy)nucleoside triphosphate pyrophosphohydrolase n=1 Tax=Microbacterium sp. ARD31 TaxID=2962576 RepID=UPI0028810957|nr:(deoxy)nucleoside triphosphate pyrophosphohydrolase [Microbacterium sp. ARD31]MDT0179547.1 (deoxy)nucleoside triphosphate pyrophosphohydrolase [Microbacterium sp. ARD31]
MSTERALDVVAAVVLRDGLVFAARRSPEKAQGGKWEFPGGKIEPGETARAALMREIKEELGVQLSVRRHFATSTTQVDDLKIRLRCFLADFVDGEPVESADHDLLRWVPSEELVELDWAPADLPAVALLSTQG